MLPKTEPSNNSISTSLGSNSDTIEFAKANWAAPTKSKTANKSFMAQKRKISQHSNAELTPLMAQ